MNWIETQSSKHRRKGYPVSIFAEVNIHLVVHCELVDGVDTILNNLLYNFELPNFVNDVDSIVVTDQNDVVIEGVRFDDGGEVEHLSA